jgi:hypothetical protein
VNHDAVLDTLSLIALEAYDCHSRAEYYIYCTCVGYSMHYVFLTIGFVCQTSTVVAAVPTVSYYFVYILHAIVSNYVLCSYASVYGIPTFIYILLGIQLLDIRQHYSIYD